MIRSKPMRDLPGLIERVALGSAAVLITGETGTGKELVARALHRCSPRSVAVSNRDLEEAARAGTFRTDLYDRLCQSCVA